MQGMDGWFDWYVFRTFSTAHHHRKFDKALEPDVFFPPDAVERECRHGACPTDSEFPAGCGCWDG